MFERIIGRLSGSYDHDPGRRGASLDAISHTEKVIAFCRVLLAGITLALAIVDPKEPHWPRLTYTVLGAYVGFSALLFLLVRREHVRHERVGPASVAFDIAWSALITLLTEGGATPFFLLNVFVISSVSLRWGFAASAPVTVLLACLYPALIFSASWLDPAVFTFHRAHLFRPAYLVALGYLIGFLGEHERRSKRKLGFMLDLSTTFRHPRSVGWGLSKLMRRVLRYFDAPRGILVLRDPESTRYFIWDLTCREGRLRLGLGIADKDPFPLAFASSTEAFLANTVLPGTGTALCYDVVSGAMQRKAIPPETRLPAGAEGAQALLMAPVLVQRELRGRAAVVRESRSKFTREDLEFLLLIVGQAAAGFEAVRLHEKAEEVAVLEERARIARDLHDGFIQSLAGIDLRVEACRKLLDRDPARVPAELDDLQATVDRGYREVRHYLRVLRSASRRAGDVSAALDRVAAEFAMRDRLKVRLSLPDKDPGLSPATAYELAQVAREALSNAVRHGEATEAVIKLAAHPTYCSLLIRDNGRGFQNGQRIVDDEGQVIPSAVPWSIRERAEALGGSLSVRSQAGKGAEISLRVPQGAVEGDGPPRPRRPA